MNRYRPEKKYVFRPPKYSSFWAPIIYWFSDSAMLRRKFQITSVKVTAGGEEVLERYKRGDALLIAPNHSDHSDPHSLLHLSRRYKIPLHFMAAREIFLRKMGIHGAILQRAGVFSIDREGSDLKSIKEAMRILYDGKFPLVMFPEGEIYHLNERLTPLNEGAANLALRAAKKIKKDKPGSGAWIIPTAMKYRYVEDISDSFPERLSRLEERIAWAPQNHLSVVDRIYKFGEAILALKEKELLNRTFSGPLNERLQEFRELLIQEEESRYLGKPGQGNHPTRVRMLRGKIRSIILADETPPEETLHQCYRSLDRLYVAIQLYSYPGQYLREKPSMDRIAETLHKFEEDLFEENLVRGERIVEITFCKPVDLMARMDDFAKDTKATVAAVTTEVQDAIRAILE